LLPGAIALAALLSVVLLPLLNASASGTKKPEALVLPVVTPASPVQGTAESGTTGSWVNGPTSLGYQWELCSATGKECVNITGATGSTYTPGEADAEHTLVLKVTATNSEGATSASSAATGKVPPAGQVTEYKVSGYTEGVAAGADGNVWFTNYGNSKIDKVTPSGTVTEYALPEKSGPFGIAAGPSGNLWFTDKATGKIGKITTSGTVTEYALPSGSGPRGIAEGPEKDLWFTNEATGKIGKITTSGTVTEYALPEKSHPLGIVAGPDGNLWFVGGGKEISSITPSGTITEYAISGGASAITVGPEKEDLWFTGGGTGADDVGKITTSGTFTEYVLPEKSDPTGIAAGPDGSLWVAESLSKHIARVTAAGTITEYTANASLLFGAIVAGPDGYMWFTAGENTGIGKIAP